MIYNKKFLIGLLVAIVIIGISIATFVTSQNQKEAADSAVDTAAQTQASAPIPFRIDFSSHPEIEASLRTAVTSGIDRYVADVSHSGDSVGAIRNGSYNQTANGSSSLTVFLIDIPSMKRSYKISFGRDTSTDEQSLYVLCPAASELIYPPFNCKDDLSEIQ